MTSTKNQQVGGRLSDSALRYFRWFAFWALVGCVSSLQHSNHPDNFEDDKNLHSLLQTKKIRFMFATLASFPAAVMIEAAMDLVYYPGVSSSSYELLFFTVTTMVCAGAVSLTVYEDLSVQMFVVGELCRRMTMMNFVGVTMNELQPDVIPGWGVITLSVLIGIKATVQAYFERNISEFHPAIRVVGWLLSFTIFIVGASFFTSALVKVFKNATRAAAEQSFAASGVARSCARLTFVQSWQYASAMRPHHLTRLDVLTLLYVVPTFFLMPASVYRSNNLSTLNENDLVFVLTAQGVLTALLIMLPSRLVRYDVMNMQQALETKRQLSRHTFGKMRTPLNVVVLGLRLLQSKNESERKQQREQGQQQGGRGRGDSTKADVGLSAINSQLAHCEAEMSDLLDSVRQSCCTTIETLNDMLVYDMLDGGMQKLDLFCCRVLPFVRLVVQPFLVVAQLQRITVKIIDKVAGTVTTFHPQNPAGLGPGITVSESLTDGPVTDLWVRIDPVKMGQVLRNFLSNALKFTPQGGCVSVVMSAMSEPFEGQPSAEMGPETSADAAVDAVQLSDQFTAVLGGSPIVFGRDAQRPLIRLSVTDTGAGLSVDTMGRLFQDSVQFEPNEQQRGSSVGSGFGLKITKKIVDLHGGTVGASSNGVGKGSTFFANLPLYFQAVPQTLQTGTTLSVSPVEQPVETKANSFFGRLFTPRVGADYAVPAFDDTPGAPSTRSLASLLLASPESTVALRAMEEEFTAGPAFAFDRAVVMLRGRGSARVLLAVQSPVCRGMIRRLLLEVDGRLAVDEAGSGQECVDLLRRAAEGGMGVGSGVRDIDGVSKMDSEPSDNRGYAAVILDNDLEGLGGMEVAKICREAPRLDRGGSGVGGRRSGRRHHGRVSTDERVIASPTGTAGAYATGTDQAPGVGLYGGPILGLSGLASEDDLKEFVEAGADFVMTKPVDVDLFVHVLARLVLKEGTW